MLFRDNTSSIYIYAKIKDPANFLPSCKAHKLSFMYLYKCYNRPHSLRRWRKQNVGDIFLSVYIIVTLWCHLVCQEYRYQNYTKNQSHGPHHIKIYIFPKLDMKRRFSIEISRGGGNVWSGAGGNASNAIHIDCNKAGPMYNSVSSSPPHQLWLFWRFI